MSSHLAAASQWRGASLVRLFGAIIPVLGRHGNACGLLISNSNADLLVRGRMYEFSSADFERHWASLLYPARMAQCTTVDLEGVPSSQSPILCQFHLRLHPNEAKHVLAETQIFLIHLCRASSATGPHFHSMLSDLNHTHKGRENGWYFSRHYCSPLVRRFFC